MLRCGNDTVAQQGTETVAQARYTPQYLSEEKSPTVTEEFHVVGLLDEFHRWFPTFDETAIIQSGADAGFVIAQGVGFHSVTAHHCTADIEPQLTSGETECDVMQEGFHLMFIEIHQNSFDNEDELGIGVSKAQGVHPTGLEQ